MVFRETLNDMQFSFFFEANVFVKKVSSQCFDGSLYRNGNGKNSFTKRLESVLVCLGIVESP